MLHSRALTRVLCVIAAGLIALAVDSGITVLYAIPVAVFASTSDRAAAVAFGLACSVVSEAFGNHAHLPGAVPRLIFGFIAYAGLSLLIVEVILRRRLATEAMYQLRQEAAARAQSESDLISILDSSPVGFLLVSADGGVRRVNRQAARMLRLPEESSGQVDVMSLIPALRNFLKSEFLQSASPLMMETEAWRQDGEAFLCRIWLSCDESRRAGAISLAIADVTEDVRTAEVNGLQDLLAGSRVMLGALSHEIRNVAGAVAMTARLVKRMDGEQARPEVEALATLASGLENLASGQLRSVDPRTDSRTDLGRVLQEVAIIADPEFRALQITFETEVDERDVWVRGEHHSVLQAVLNIVNNAIREFSLHPGRAHLYRIRVECGGDRVQLRADVAGTIDNPDDLFQPFGERSKGTGLGLYVSRTVLRSFGGDLRYQADPPCFVLEFAVAHSPAAAPKDAEWATA